MKVERSQFDIADFSKEDLESLVDLFNTLNQWYKERELSKSLPGGSLDDAFKPKENRKKIQSVVGIQK